MFAAMNTPAFFLVSLLVLSLASVQCLPPHPTLLPVNQISPHCFDSCDSPGITVGGVQFKSVSRAGSMAYARLEADSTAVDARVLVFCHTFTTSVYTITFGPTDVFVPINCSQNQGFGAVVQSTVNGVTTNQYFTNQRTTGQCWDGFCAKEHGDAVFDTDVGSLDIQNPAPTGSFPILLNFNQKAVDITYYCYSQQVNNLVPKSFTLDGFTNTSDGQTNWAQIDESCDRNDDGNYPYWIARVDFTN
uniref:Uncharacterized protein n=1 Tax=Paramoeba aestuarina TaxID=180227 RepID=A0A7S4L017_9EUKA